MKITNNIKYSIAFILVAIILGLIFHYNKTIFYPPLNEHIWRQSDCASFAMRFYQDGNGLFSPRVYNYLNNGGWCVGETPVLYFFIAQLYKIFGPSDFIFRIVVLIIFFIGLFNLFKLTYRITKEYYIAFLIPLFLFSIPLIWYYGNGFLMDMPALSLTFIGWNYFFKYKETGIFKNLFISLIIIGIAATFKLTAILSLITISILFVMEIGNWINLNDNNEKLFKNKKLTSIAIITGFSIFLSHYLWSLHYIEKNHVAFLGTTVWPNWSIWDTTDGNFVQGFRLLFGFINSPLGKIPFLLFLVSTAFVIVNIRQLNMLLKGIYVFLFIGVIVFIATIFYGIAGNSYYIINLMTLPVFTFILSFKIIIDKYPVIYKSVLFKIVTISTLILFIYIGKSEYKGLQKPNTDNFSTLNKVYYKEGFGSFIDKNIPKKSLVISLPDVTPNATLYLLKRAGFSEYGLLSNPSNFLKAIYLKAEYLVVSDTNIIHNKYNLTPFIEKKVDNFENLYVYKLIDSVKAISLKGFNNLYVSSELNGAFNLNCSKKEAGICETFYVYPYKNGKIALLSDNAQYISINPEDQTGNVMLDKTYPQEWEKLQIIKIDSNSFVFKTANNKYLSIANDDIIFSNSDTITNYCKFKISEIKQ